MNFFSMSKLIGAAWYQNIKRPGRTVVRRPRLALELLEARTVPSITTTLPSPLVTTPTSIGGGFDPQVVIDPLNPLKMVEVHTNGTNLYGTFSIDGGQSWSPFGFTTIPAGPRILADNILDPNLDQGHGNQPQRFTVAESPSISFDRGEQVYVVSAEHDAGNTSGAIVLLKFDFSGNSPSFVSLNPSAPPSTVLSGAISSSDTQFNVPFTPAGFTTANGPFVATISTARTWQLASDMLASDNSLQVTSATPTPPATPFTITIGSEQLRVTSVSGTTWAVTRGVNDTTAAPHSQGSTVTAPPLEEQVLVTDITNNTWTVQRGYNTTAVAHAAGSTVTAGGATTWDLNGNGVLYRWLNQGSNYDAAFNPVVAVDTNLPTYTDPVTGEVQTDTMATMVNNPTYGLVPKGVFVAWNVLFKEPTGAIINTASRVVIEGSADGGHSFSTVQRVSNPSSDDNAAAPRIVFTQGSANLANNLAGGLMQLYWDGTDVLPVGAFTTGISQDSTSLDGGVADAPVVATQSFSGSTGGITDAIKGGSTLTWTLAAPMTTLDNTLTVQVPLPQAPLPVPFTIKIDQEQMTVVGTTGTNQETWTVVRGQGGTTAAAHTPAANDISASTSGNDIEQKTTFTAPVDINAANLTSITDLDVVLNIEHPHDNQLRIVLIAPDGTRVTLANNGINQAGQGTGQGLADGQNIGDRTFFAQNFYTHNDAGTVFDDQADRSIRDGNASAPYIGHYRPEGNSLATLFQGKSISQLNGTWTLEITDFRNDPSPSGSPRYPEAVRGWTLHFTGLLDRNDFTDESAVILGGTVAPSFSNSYTTTNPAAGARGIGPSLSVAVDNTLGGLSPYQGRIYMTYTGGGGTDTNVFLLYSDDNGNSWTGPTKVNDDTPFDNFSEGNRAQFQTTTAVDPVTGALVITYFDARNDAANARVANAVVVSVDGGDTFSPVAYANATKTATDFLTGKVESYGPIPGNQAQAGSFGFGDRQGLAAYGGNIYPIFATNLNSGGTSIFTAQVRTAGGPRITYGDMGPLTTDFSDPDNFISYNDTFASDGTRRLDGFVIQFDRPVDITSFTAADVRVKYQDPNGVPGNFVNIALDSLQPITALDSAGGWGPNGVGDGTLAETFFVKLATPQTKVGTYSYSIGPDIQDRIQVATSLAADMGVSTAGTAQTITVTSSIGIRPTATTPVVVQVGTEQLLVTNVSGNTWTVQRGYGLAAGAPVPAHLAGQVNQPPTFVAYIGNQLDQNTVGGLGGVNVAAGAKTNPVVRIIPTTTLAKDDPGGTVRAYIVVASSLPGIPGATIQIDSEQMVVTSVDTTTVPGEIHWFVTRGVNDTTKTTHLAGASITIPGAGVSYSDQDSFSIPKPTSGIPFSAPYDLTTLPLIITGPYLLNTSVNGQPASSDNLVLNGTNNSIDVSFDRDINPATFTPADIISIIGPTGEIKPTVAEPFTVSQLNTTLASAINAGQTQITVASSLGISPTFNEPVIIRIDNEVMAVTGVSASGTTWSVIRGYDGTAAASHAASAAVKLPRTFRIGLPTQTLSGTYTVNIGSDISDTNNYKLDTNFNAGLDLLRGYTDPTNATIKRPVYRSDDPGQTPQTSVNKVGGISAGDTMIPVASNARFPSTATSGSFVVVIGTEQILVTDNTTTNWVVTRGYNNTTAAQHNDKLAVTLIYQIPALGSVSSSITIPDNFTIQQSPTRSFFDGLTQTSVSVNVSATAGTLSVTSNAGFPTTGSPLKPFVIQVGTEQMQVTAVNGTVWTVTRGFNNTVQSAHNASSPVLLGKPATIEVELDITHPNDPDLSATLSLVSPTGQVIQTVQLFQNVGSYSAPNHANFFGTVFDDTASSPIATTGTPVPAGPFTPQTKLGVFDGHGTKEGTWVLTVTNNGTTNTTGVLTHWELRLPGTVPGSGLGEPNADRTAASFRIFTQATTNDQSYRQWTPVGPASSNSGGNSGRIGGLAVDPSDPSGNTVYVAGASGGVWKTTDFLTTSPNGPTYVQLTDLGPSYSLNIGSLAVFGRNNDPDQTVIFAATGEGDVASSGFGFLRSTDGGRTWQVLDSTTNVDNAGAILPVASAARDHIFVGTTAFKVAVDPTPLPNGNIVVYAALSGGVNAGLWRSIDAGNHWVRIRAGDATDVVLAPASRDSNGNISVVYGAFRGEGVFITHAPLSSTPMDQLNGGQIFVTRVDNVKGFPAIPVAQTANPNGNKGRIVLATPALSNDPLKDFFYQGWIYATVVKADSTLDGVYLSKDFGYNWTRLHLPSVTAPGGVTGTFPTNNETRTEYDPLSGGGIFKQGNYDVSFAIDPNNPNITYLGGTADGAPFPVKGMIRIDATMVDDPYTLSAYSNDEADTGLPQTSTAGPTALKAAGGSYGIIDPFSKTNPLSAYLNLYRTPNDPFQSNATLKYSNVAQFTNTGTDVRWMPFNDALEDSTDQHEIIAIRDPLTGGTRLIFGDDQGVWTGVDKGDGTVLDSVGTAQLPLGSRNGNLQITQFYYGASQPSTLAADIMSALFYGQAQDNGSQQSAGDVLTTGNLNWVGPEGDGTGVATDQTGGGTVYRYNWPCCNGLGTNTTPSDFFIVTQNNNGTITDIGRTSGLIQNANDIPGPGGTGQWPNLGGSDFAVNPVDGSAVAMSSQAGRVFLTAGQNTGGYGKQWFVVADPTDLDGTYAGALAFGAPIPSTNVTQHSVNDFIYAGTNGGRIFVTFDQGGFNGSSQWRNISTGLDGSAVQEIVTNPKAGTYEAYAVTRAGVYWMKDSHAANPAWVKINDLPSGAGPNALPSTSLVAASPVTPTDPTITVAASAVPNFPPPTPFVIQIGSEQMKVTNVNGTTWTVVRGYNLTQPVTHNDGDTVRQVDPLFGLNRPVFNNLNDPYPALRYLTTIQADWRFSIPDDPGTGAATTLNGAVVGPDPSNPSDPAFTQLTVTSSANFPAAPTPQSPFVVQIDSELIAVTNVSGNTWTVIRGFQGTTAAAHADGSNVTEYLTHPVLYVGGEGGVFRSQNKGKVWTNFPNLDDDGATQEGGYLPNVHVTDLDLVLGNVDTTTGFTEASSGLNLLLATTYGRGAFAIRLDNSAVQSSISVPNSGPQVVTADPILGANGLNLAGFTVTFKGDVDPSTFRPGDLPSDVVVTGPNGSVAIASITDVTNLGTSGGIHNTFQILFQTAQTTTGNYTLKVGPDIRDQSGNLMDQNNNNKNGEPPAPSFAGDVYTTVYHFVANTIPTITNPGTGTPPSVVVSPNATANNVFTFTVGDAETPAAQLQVTATSSNQAILTDAQITLGGSGANRTITVNPGSVHGYTDITLTVTDGNGLTKTVTFRLYVDLAPMFNITDPSAVPHGSGPLAVPLNASDPDGDPLTYSVTLSDPLYDLKTTYGLTAAPTSATIAGQRLWVYRSSTNKNPGPGHANLFVLTSDNKLYAWRGSLPATLHSAVLADFTTDAYKRDVFAKPTLIPGAAAPISLDATDALAGEALTTDAASLALAALKAKYGLTKPAIGFNLRGAGEWYFRSTNGSNAAFGRLFVLLPNNTLLAWRGAVGKGVLVADFKNDPAYGNKDVYGEPALLSSASDLLVDPQALALYDVKAKYGLTAAATAANLPSTALGAKQPVWVYRSSNGSNAAHAGLYILTAGNQLFAWQGSYDKSVKPAFQVADFTDTAKYGTIDVFAQPKLLSSATDFLTQPAVLASVDGTGSGTLTITPPAGFEGTLGVTVKVFDNIGGSPVLSDSHSFPYEVTNTAPTLDAIADQSIPHGTLSKDVPLTYGDVGDSPTAAVYRVDFSDALYDLKVKYGLTAVPVAANLPSPMLGAPQKVWVYKSSNGSNPGPGHAGIYIVTGDNKLFAWQGSYDASVAQPPVADFTDSAYQGANVFAAPNMIPKAQAPATPTVNVNRGPLYDVKSQFGLSTPATLATIGGQSVLIFRSSNGSNAANGGLYVLAQVSGHDNLYAWQGSLPATTAQPALADLSGSGVWSNPALLTGARPVVVQDALFDLKEVLGLTTAATAANLPSTALGAKQPVWVYRSSNGSNAAHAGLYILTAGNQLFAWQGSYDKSVVGQTPVADFNSAPYSQNVYANPVLLTEANGRVVAVTTSTSGNTLTLTPNPAFAGSVRVTVTASDGAESASPPQSFLFTVTNAAPTLQQPTYQTVPSGNGSVQVNVGASDSDGTLVYYPVQISGNPLADLVTKYKLTNPATAVTLNSQSGPQNVLQFKASTGALYILVSSGPTDGGQLYAWRGSYDASVARPPVADFTTGLYTGLNVYQNVTTDPSYLANQTQPSLTGVTGSISGGMLTVSWPSGFTGTFAVKVTVGDGASEVERSFLVTVQ